jgi:hypothetical protein
MSIKHQSTFTVMTAILLGFAGICSAQTSSSPAASSTSTTTGSTAPYTAGSGWVLTMVRTKRGMGDDYLKLLAKNYKLNMEEQKKQNLIVSYKILQGEASTRDDFDLLLMVEYKNMAAFDGQREKIDPIDQKITGGEEQQRQGATKRAEVRDILGDKTMREITLK